MFSLLKYIIIFFLVVGGLFWLDRQGVDIKGSLLRAEENVLDFFKSIGNSPKLDRTAIFKGLDKIDLVGALGSSTATSTKKKNEVKADVIEAKLSVAGIVKYTNLERTKRGLKPLIVNKKLATSADRKTDDMFTKQYFEHVSPSGESVADLVRDAGYEYEIVAENLALGNFGTDQKLVTAWMDSPKHRANILNPKFTEIGVSASNGLYKSERQWIFVQHFGKPVPLCDKADVTLKARIDKEKAALEIEERELKEMATVIESNPNRDPSYLEQYNARVAAYNNRLTALKELVAIYNAQVGQYNQCRADN